MTGHVRLEVDALVEGLAAYVADEVLLAFVDLLMAVPA